MRGNTIHSTEFIFGRALVLEEPDKEGEGFASDKETFSFSSGDRARGKREAGRRKRERVGSTGERSKGESCKVTFSFKRPRICS